MDSIKTLEDIGLREVSRKTYIELKYLKLITEKDFAKLHRINTLGFIKIIQREYGVDMKDWVEEFEAYLKEHNKTKEEDEKALVEHQQKNIYKKFYILAAVGIFVLVAGFLYAIIKDKPERVEPTPEPSAVVEKTLELISEQENLSANITAETDESVAEVAATTPPAPIFAQLSPNIAIWVGVIDLTTGKKSTYLQTESIKFDLSKEQIVITGHGNFKFKIQDEPDINFGSPERVYLHIKDNAIKEIAYSEFTALNKGKSW